LKTTKPEVLDLVTGVIVDLLEKKKHRPSSRTPPGLIGDGDLIGLSSGLVGRPHVQDPGVVKNMALVSKNKEHSAYPWESNIIKHGNCKSLS
jgi:hypothetical protein